MKKNQRTYTMLRAVIASHTVDGSMNPGTTANWGNYFNWH